MSFTKEHLNKPAVLLGVSNVNGSLLPSQKVEQEGIIIGISADGEFVKFQWEESWPLGFYKNTYSAWYYADRIRLIGQTIDVKLVS